MTRDTSIALDKLQEEIRTTAKRIARSEVGEALATLESSINAGIFTDLGITTREDYLIWLTRPQGAMVITKRIMEEDPATSSAESVWSNCLAMAIADEIGNHARELLDN